jgi:hypothetical protein
MRFLPLWGCENDSGKNLPCGAQMVFGGLTLAVPLVRIACF